VFICSLFVSLLTAFDQLSEDESEFLATSPENSRFVFMCFCGFECLITFYSDLRCHTQLLTAVLRAFGSERTKRKPLPRSFNHD
jgi:hypothetical protein